MAQNITLLGASYSDVPAVTLPKTGGGTARFTDVTDSTAVASDVLSGKYFYKSDGSKIEGSIPSKAATTYTPGTVTQTLESGVYLSGAQTISGDSDLISSNIKSGVNIFGVNGSSTVVDVSNTTATAANVRSGYYFYTSAGTRTQGSLANGSATAPATISGSAATATVSGSPAKLVLSKTISVTPIVTAGYIASGTAGNSTVTLTSNINPKGSQTYTPTTSDQTISSGVYLTGNQTIKGDANLVASNIKKDVTIFGVTGTYEGPADMVDWIIEQGSISGTNAWKYAIYHSGRAECWCDTASGDRTTSTQWGNWYYSTSTVGGNAYPVDKNGHSLFGSKPYATLEYVATSNDAVCSIHRDGSATAAPTGYVYRPNNGTVTGFLRIFARGTVNSSWAGV